jgi:hypothetical protein
MILMSGSRTEICEAVTIERISILAQRDKIFIHMTFLDEIDINKKHFLNWYNIHNEEVEKISL